MSTPEGFTPEQLSDEEILHNRITLPEDPEGLVYEIPDESEIGKEKNEPDYSPTMNASHRKEYFARNRDFRKLAEAWSQANREGKLDAKAIFLASLYRVVAPEYFAFPEDSGVIKEALRDVLHNDLDAKRLSDDLWHKSVKSN